MTEPVAFRSAAAFRTWLRRHHRSAASLVVRCFKVHAANRGMTHKQGLDEALCYGWIDGVVRRIDDDSYSVRFSPRQARSIWSKVNVRRVEELIAAGRMTPAGQTAFDARKASRTGIYSFEQPAATLGASYRRAFQRSRRAWTYYQAEAPWYRRTTAHWVMSAKREPTRVRRLAILIACSAKGQRIPALPASP